MMQYRNEKLCVSVPAHRARPDAYEDVVCDRWLTEWRALPAVAVRVQLRRNAQARQRRRGGERDQRGAAFSRGATEPDRFGAHRLGSAEHDEGESTGAENRLGGFQSIAARGRT